MELIDKSAVVAEIERRIQFFIQESGNSNSDIVIALFGLKSFLDTLDTLEVKEVDLEKEVNAYMVNEMKFLSDEVGYDTLSTIAKHFFELGIKAQKGE